MTRLASGSEERRAATEPGSEDPLLSGRTYAIPFETVWQAAREVVRRDLRGWTLIAANDRVGRIDALARTLLLNRETEVVITIGLDENAQTRVDVRTLAREARGDFAPGRRMRRMIRGFIRRLDRALDVAPGQILDPASLPSFGEQA